MYFKNQTLGITALSIAVSIFTLSCSKGDDINDIDDRSGVQISQHSTFGAVLTDEDGRALYFFSNDNKGTSTCSGGCLAAWPAYHADDVSTDSKIDKSLLGEISRNDGSKQTTYKGWPLYYFAGDNAPGQVNGDGSDQIWYVAKPDYIVMVANGQLSGADGKNYKEDYAEGNAATLYLTDDVGRTLYAFMPDRFNQNNYTDATFSNNSVWPIFYKNPGAIPTLIKSDDFATLSVHGRNQLSFRGWPLYHFGQDTKRGDNKGVSVPRPGVWPILNSKTSVAPSN